MVEVNVEQRTPEWIEYRLGKITGTRLKEVLRSDNLPLVYEMIAEVVSKQIEEIPVNRAMQRGVDLEPVVRQLYQDKHNEIIMYINNILIVQ
jgi:hypothetical protein